MGIGKLGLCYALNLERCGYKVIGTDINPIYIEALANKTFYSYEPGVNELLQTARNFTPSTNIQLLLADEVEMIFVMVATPTAYDGSYDHSQVESVVGELIKYGKRNRPIHLIIACTVMPGYCDELAGRLVELNYLVSYNPEFIAQGNIINNQLTPDQILIGEANEEAGKMIEEVCLSMCRNTPSVHRMDRLSAEIAKFATNCFLTTKIAFANAIGDLATKANANTDKILACVGADSRVGPKFLKYGFGYGGPCLPRDNRALGVFANKIGYDLIVGKATDAANKSHLQFQLQEYLVKYKPEEIIVFKGVAFKDGSVALDESQKLALALLLVERNRKVKIVDHPTVIDEINRNYPNVFITEKTS